jgi:hypothetical protein
MAPNTGVGVSGLGRIVHQVYLGEAQCLCPLSAAQQASHCLVGMSATDSKQTLPMPLGQCAHWRRDQNNRQATLFAPLRAAYYLLPRSPEANDPDMAGRLSC